MYPQLFLLDNRAKHLQLLKIFALNFQIRLSSGEKATGMGRNWVEWDLPADRDVDTFWRLSLGDRSGTTDHKVNVRSTFASARYCYQNKYGITSHFTGYPGTLDVWSHNGGGISPHTVCMIVNVIAEDSGRYFCPGDNDHWPPGKNNTQPPFVSVWLK